jgi:hypothetical protein
MAATVAVALAAALAAGAARAASVEVKDAVVRVTVVPEARGDVKVEVLSANPRLPLQVRSFAGRTIVDGRLERRIRGCHGGGADGVRVDVRGVGEVAWRDIPQLVIRTPKEVDILAGGAVWGQVGRSAALKLGNAGCGDWTVANVAGPMRITQAGSGNTRAGSAGEARIRVAGSGDTVLADVHGPLGVTIAGSGDVSVASVSGPFEAQIMGSGDVSVMGGHATAMKVLIAGSGNVDFRGAADTLKARVAGSGDVRARQVTGAVSKTIVGSGGVTIGR